MIDRLDTTSIFIHSLWVRPKQKRNTFHSQEKKWSLEFWLFKKSFLNDSGKWYINGTGIKDYTSIKSQ